MSAAATEARRWRHHQKPVYVAITDAAGGGVKRHITVSNAEYGTVSASMEMDPKQMQLFELLLVLGGFRAET